jgi:hypothetical protein
MKIKISNLIRLFTLVLVISGFSISTACSSGPASNSPSSIGASDTNHAISSPNPSSTPTAELNSTSNNIVTVVVAGYINHGPLQSTVSAIKEVLTKYGDSVKVQWVDLDTDEGAKYFKDHNLSAHMNVVINGKLSYPVNDKAVTFTWFEGQNWTKQDMDTLLSSLINK